MQVQRFITVPCVVILNRCQDQIQYVNKKRKQSFYANVMGYFNFIVIYYYYHYAKYSETFLLILIIKIYLLIWGGGGINKEL